jgi:hypothetical protein
MGRELRSARACAFRCGASGNRTGGLLPFPVLVLDGYVEGEDVGGGAVGLRVGAQRDLAPTGRLATKPGPPPSMAGASTRRWSPWPRSRWRRSAASTRTRRRDQRGMTLPGGADIIVIGGGHNGLTCAAYLAPTAIRERCSLTGWTACPPLRSFEHGGHAAHPVMATSPSWTWSSPSCRY